MAIHDLGDLVKVQGTFTNAAGAAIDPTAVLCQIIEPDGVETTLTYGTDASLVKSATGVYYVNIDADKAGTWRYRFYSTGTGQAAAEGWFEVSHSAFV